MSFGSVSNTTLLSQGPGGQGLEHLHLHRRGRLSGTAAALRRPRDHAGGHGPVRRARGDDPARPDRGVQVRPGRQAGPGRPPAGRQEHPGRRHDARDGRRASRCSRRSRSTASTRSKTTRSTSTGSSTSTRGRCSRRRSRRRPTWTWSPWAATTPGTHIVHLDGSYGGTGAAPDIAKKNIAMPIEYAIGQGAQVPRGRGHPRPGHADRQRRHPQRPTTSPRRSPWAPTACVIGTAELVALGCIRCAALRERPRLSPRHRHHRPELLAPKIDLEWGTQRLINLYNAWRNDAGRHSAPPGPATASPRCADAPTC